MSKLVNRDGGDRNLASEEDRRPVAGISSGSPRLANGIRRSRGRAVRLGFLVGAFAIALVCGAWGSSSSSFARTSKGTVLTMGESSPPADLTPATGGDIERSDLFAYEGIFNWSFSGKAVPGLATSWKYLPSKPANEVFEFTLRHDARFADGTPVTAQAVRTYLEYVAKHAPGGDFYLGVPAWVHTSGKWTVILRVKTPNPLIPYALSNFNPGPGHVASPRCVAHPSRLTSGDCGAGPYMLDNKATVTGSKYIWVKNPYYYNKAKQPWSKIVVLVIPTPSSMLEAMKTGEVDLAQGDVSTARAAKADGFKVLAAPTYNAGLFLNQKGTDDPLANLQVRQAMNYAINRPLLASTFGGIPTDEVRTDGGYDPAFARYYSYNLAKAKSLMAAAGYSQGFTLDTISYGPYGTQGTPLVQAEASQLAAIGIKLNITPQATEGAWGTAYGLHPSVYQAPFGVDFTPVYYGILMAGKASGWTDPTIDHLEQESLVAPPATAYKYWQKISARVVTQAYELMTLTTPGYYFVNTKVVKNVQATPKRIIWDPPSWSPA